MYLSTFLLGMIPIVMIAKDMFVPKVMELVRFWITLKKPILCVIPEIAFIGHRIFIRHSRFHYAQPPLKILLF